MKVDNDDIAAVEAYAPQWAKQLFNSLLTRPASPPFTISEQDRPKWWTKQDAALTKCRKKMQSTTDIKDACAQSMMIVGRVIKLHKEGASVNHLEATSAARVKQANGQLKPKTPGIRTRTNNYDVDRFITCSTRLERIVNTVRDSKRVALDVIEGEKWKMDDLVRSRTACARVKRRNFKNNNRRNNVLSRGKTTLSAGTPSQATIATNEDVDTTTKMETRTIMQTWKRRAGTNRRRSLASTVRTQGVRLRRCTASASWDQQNLNTVNGDRLAHSSQVNKALLCHMLAS
jgi:hypothetical protein